MQDVCHMIGAPVDSGAGQRGCAAAPGALRAAGLVEAMTESGYSLRDFGDLPAPRPDPAAPAGAGLRNRAETLGWIRALAAAAGRLGGAGELALFLGGDHSIAAATVPAMAARAARAGRPLFVLWLDAHPDLHCPGTTESGNIHGMPVAYFTGQRGFDAFPDVPATVVPAHVCMIGLRSVDTAERRRIAELGICTGGAEALAPFLSRAAAAGAHLHVSLDADFLGPSHVPGVGTPVAGGPDPRAAMEIMRRVSDSGLLTSLDLVEVNPRLDPSGRTARLMTGLAAALCRRPEQLRLTGS